MNEKQIPIHILPIIVLSQFAGTSLWFAGNAVSLDLIRAYQLPIEMVGYMTSSVQLGFISGTLLFAFLTIADRFSPTKVFLVSALLGSFFNLLIVFSNGNLNFILLLRFLTGFFLAGIYPVGMKIASDWYREGLGKALGFLVGALTLGTALPHILKTFPLVNGWKEVFMATSLFASLGGIILYSMVKNGPFRKKGIKLQTSNFLKGFKNKRFRGAAFGYFGHMWELYAFWTFLPILLKMLLMENDLESNISFWSFLVIFAGTLGCIISGYLAKMKGSGYTAFLFLLISGICCLLSPILIFLPTTLAIVFLLVWGFSVVADSPQFSTLVAKYAAPEYRGSALTLVNSIGFAITIPSIELLNYLFSEGKTSFMWLFLLPGPVIGLFFILRSKIINLELNG
ncbi:MAG: MFS transporter [Cyclobacteriaceae bacterium]|nr:MFS transporter [Cyclobacteriaceae bacterium]